MVVVDRTATHQCSCSGWQKIDAQKSLALHNHRRRDQVAPGGGSSAQLVSVSNAPVNGFNARGNPFSARRSAFARTTETEVTHMSWQRDRLDLVPSPRSKKIRLPRSVYLELVAMRGSANDRYSRYDEALLCNCIGTSDSCRSVSQRHRSRREEVIKRIADPDISAQRAAAPKAIAVSWGAQSRTGSFTPMPSYPSDFFSTQWRMTCERPFPSS
jgi:hypothetical protein